jgi:outer membrane lipoprotein-sorting protein
MISGAGCLRRIVRAAPVLLLAVALQAVADEARWDFAQLMAELARVETSRARYSEVKRVSMLKEPLFLSGTLSYARPDRMEKRQTSPFVEVIRVEGERLTVERDGRTRSISLRGAPMIDALVESLRATLAGDAAALQNLYTVSVDGAQPHWRLLLTPRDPEVAAAVRKIMIAGSGARLSRIEILEPGGDSTVMTIRDDSP